MMDEPVLYVVRRAPGGDGEPRTLYSGPSETKARRVLRKHAALLRHGSVELWVGGKIVARSTAERLRLRW